MIEPEVRYQIDRSLESNGWILDVQNVKRNVFLEGAVKQRLSQRSVQRLGFKTPDYTLFDSTGLPLAILEAKKSGIVNLDDALSQARDYADRIEAEIVFACNGTSLKSEYMANNKPLFVNGYEVITPPPPSLLKQFQLNESNEIYTVPREVIKSREELIRLFAEINDDIRYAGIRNSERFSEFANILFLKLLSEKGDDEIWNRLLRLSERELLPYLNNVAMAELKKNYGGDVISKTEKLDATTMAQIISKLNPLSLTDIDEDIKGVAFEHFIEKSTDTRNDLGEYFTPRHVVRFMVRLLNPLYGQNLYDPFCGTGGFLTESFKHISQQKQHTHDSYEVLRKRTVFGSEVTSTSRIAKMNMILFGDGHSGVKRSNSLETKTTGRYNNVLSNIPFSLKKVPDTLSFAGYDIKDSDEACVMRCFDSLKAGGSMAIVVPDGILGNRSHVELMRFIFQHSRVHMIVKLPRGCFAPYTDAKTGVVYLTGKGTEQTDWFYRVDIKNDGYDNRRNPIKGINDLDKLMFFYEETDDPLGDLPEDLDVGIVKVENLQSEHSFYLHEDWKVSNDREYLKLEDVAILQNGKSITESVTTPGDIPVIAGGRGTVPYTHNESNHPGRIFTISKSGAYSGYVWWHDDPIWASDSIVTKSKDESMFLSRYLYMCMRTKQDEIYRRQQGTGQPHIYISHIRDFPIPDLSLEEQKRYLDPLDEAGIRLRRVQEDVKQLETNVERLVLSKYDDD